tara:strand:+ start:553 stop:1767 length:1215 start_codon:yes stop_codon:yes gene_type:complete
MKFILDNFRWLLASFLLFFMSSFGQTMFISIFAGNIQKEFSLSSGAWGGLYMAGTLTSAAVMLCLGGLTDVFKVRLLGSLTLLFLAISCLAMYWVQSLYLLPIIIFALRVSGQGMTTHIASVSIGRWFVATRGRAISISHLGYSLGEAILPISFVVIIGLYGWRFSWLFSSLLLLGAIPFLVFLLSKERSPKSVIKDNDCFGLNGHHWTRREALYHPLFWFLFPALLGPAAFSTAFFFLHVHYAETKGWSHFEIVSLFPIFTISSIISMIISGIIVDRFNTSKLMFLCLTPSIFGFLLLSFSGTLFITAIGVSMIAITSGTQNTLSSAFWAEFYGTKHLGSIKSIATSTMVLGSALGPGITGFAIDQGFNFSTQMPWISGYYALATIMAFIGITNFSSKRFISL